MQQEAKLFNSRFLKFICKAKDFAVNNLHIFSCIKQQEAPSLESAILKSGGKKHFSKDLTLIKFPFLRSDEH